MRAHRWISWIRALAVGLDLMVVGLVVLAVLGSLGGGAGGFWTAVAAGGVLLAVYGAGRVLIRPHDRPITAPRGAWWPDIAWTAALGALWCVLLLVSPAALWLAFPLLSAALLLLWGLWQQATARGDVGWAVTYSQNPLDWLQGLALWLGPGLALLWAGRRRSAL